MQAKHSEDCGSWRIHVVTRFGKYQATVISADATIMGLATGRTRDQAVRTALAYARSHENANQGEITRLTHSYLGE